MAQIELQVQVGRQTAGDGTKPTARGARDASLVVMQAGSKYYQLVKDGLVYVAQTAVTGVAPGTAIGTTAAAALYNPAGSGKDVVILSASLGYVSGTLGAGVVSWCLNTNLAAAAVTGTAMLTRNALAGAGDASVASPFTTATLPAAPTPVRNFCSLGASLASTAVQPWQIVDDVDGAIILKPGATASIQETGAAGSTPLVVVSLVWAELPE